VLRFSRNKDEKTDQIRLKESAHHPRNQFAPALFLIFKSYFTKKKEDITLKGAE
jgi:hypothetical protein